MTNWITLTAPKEPHRHAGPIPEVDALINEARDAAPPTTFHLRADIITEIVRSAGETVIRTSTGGQYVCGEDERTVARLLLVCAHKNFSGFARSLYLDEYEKMIGIQSPPAQTEPA